MKPSPQNEQSGWFRSAQWKNRHHAGILQFGLFLAVGGLNTAFGFGLFALLLYFGMHYSLASLVSTVLGVLFNFKTTGRIVFRSRDNRLLLRFVALYAAIFLLNLLGLKILTSIGLTAYWAGASLLLPMAALMFFLQRRFIFKPEAQNSIAG